MTDSWKLKLNLKNLFCVIISEVEMNLPLRIYKTIQTIELKFSWSENGILVINSGSSQLFNVIYAWNAAPE